MHMHDLLGWPGPMTQRQFVTWVAWLRVQWDRPDRTDGYLMQVAAEVRRGHVKNPRKVKLEDFRLKYDGGSSRKKPAMTKEQATAMSKAVWMARLGDCPKVFTPPKLEDQPPTNGEE